MQENLQIKTNLPLSITVSDNAGPQEENNTSNNQLQLQQTNTNLNKHTQELKSNLRENSKTKLKRVKEIHKDKCETSTDKAQKKIVKKLQIKMNKNAKQIATQFLTDKLHIQKQYPTVLSKQQLRKKISEIATKAISKPDLVHSKIRTSLLSTLNQYQLTINKTTKDIEKFHPKKLNQLTQSLLVQIQLFSEIMNSIHLCYKTEKQQIEQVLSDIAEKDPELINNVKNVNNDEGNERATKELQEYEQNIQC